MNEKNRPFLIFPLLILLLLPAAFAGNQEQPDRAKAYYHYIMGALKETSRQYEAAIEEYREALRHDPQSGEILSKLAYLYVQTDRVQEAVDEAKKILKQDPQNTEAHKMLGQLYMEKVYAGEGNQQDVLRAIQEFKEVHRADPEDETAILSLGQLYLKNNQFESAAELLVKYLEKYPDSATALASVASAYQQMNQPDQAITYMLKYLQLKPGNLYIIQQTADLYEKQGDSAKALEFQKRAYEIDSNNPSIVRKYVSLLEKNQKYEDAVAILEERVTEEPERAEWLVMLARMQQKTGRQETAESLIKKRLDANPNQFDLRLSLVQLYEDAADYSKAVTELTNLEKQLEVLPADAPESRSRKILVYSHLGFAYQRLKAYERSNEYYRKARLLVAPEDAAKIDLYIALNYRNQKKWDEAIEAVNSILKTNSNDTDAWELLSLIYEEKGDKDNSDKVIQHLIETHPQSLEYHMLKGERLQQRKKYQESIQYLNGLLSKFEPTDELYFLIGAAYERMKNISEAEEAFKKSLEINPSNANTLNYLGYMLIDNGIRVEESIDYVKRALEIDRDNAAYLDSLGWGYYKLNQLDLAEDNLRMALKKMETSAVVHDHMGDLYFKQGKFQEAIQHWEHALQETEDKEEIDPEQIRKKIDDTKNRLRK